MTLLHEALGAPWCVISVMGAHACDAVDVIFDRKVADCRAAGRTFWVAESAKARPLQVQELCASSAGYVIFVEPATPGGARPTTQAERAIGYSADRLNWLALPPGIGPVTGQMDRASTALVFNLLATDVAGVSEGRLRHRNSSPPRPQAS